MIFDINNHLSTANARTNQSRNAPADVKSAPTATNATPGTTTDTVELSDQARSMARLQQSMAAAPDVDMEKVESIKRAIAEGKFDFNPERIAENMLKQDELLT